MIFHYLKISFRFLSKNRLSVLINFFGLSIGIISAAFIFLWVFDELSFNKGFPNYPKYSPKESFGQFSIINLSPQHPATRTQHPEINLHSSASALACIGNYIQTLW